MCSGNDICVPYELFRRSHRSRQWYWLITIWSLDQKWIAEVYSRSRGQHYSRWSKNRSEMSYYVHRLCRVLSAGLQACGNTAADVQWQEWWWHRGCHSWPGPCSCALLAGGGSGVGLPRVCIPHLILFVLPHHSSLPLHSSTVMGASNWLFNLWLGLHEATLEVVVVEQDSDRWHGNTCGMLIMALGQSAMFSVAFALRYRGGDTMWWKDANWWQQCVVLGSWLSHMPQPKNFSTWFVVFGTGMEKPVVFPKWVLRVWVRF
jgi:hypothetical protein